MPRQSSMLCAASGSIIPGDEHVIEHAVLGENVRITCPVTMNG